jgi:hypothetical protein
MAMKTLHKRLVTTAVIASMLAIPLSVSFTGDAEARDRGYRGGGGYHHGHRGGGGNTGAYIGLGLGAFALGTALALSAQPSYAAPPAYYAPPPPPPVYYQAPTYYQAPAYYQAPTAYYAAPVYDPYRNTYVYDPQFDRNGR